MLDYALMQSSGEGDGTEATDPEEHGEVVARWPPLPAGCPPAGATPRTGTFYRLLDGSDDDWRLPVELFGVRDEENPTTECKSHAFSIFSDLGDAQEMRRRVRRFRHHSIGAISIEPLLGVILLDKPDKNTHHCWWPNATFVPPPACTMVTE